MQRISELNYFIQMLRRNWTEWSEQVLGVVLTIVARWRAPPDPLSPVPVCTHRQSFTSKHALQENLTEVPFKSERCAVSSEKRARKNRS